MKNSRRSLVRQRVSLDSKNYRYQIDIADEDETRAAQLFWNIDPIEIIALLKPYDINRSEDEALANVFYRIEYSEDDPIYAESMWIAITNLPESLGLDNLQIFAGTNGEVIDVFGNSNHPNILLFDESSSDGFFVN